MTPKRSKFRRPTYAICSTIPIPADRTPIFRGKHENGMGKVYPWSSMLPGDSFFIPENEVPVSNSLHASASRYRRVYDPSFNILVREVERGVRVWRTEAEKDERNKS